MFLTKSEIILKILSKIKYLPGTFKVKGVQTRSIFEQAQPGDIILKASTKYLDCLFRKGKYHHAGIYLDSGYVAYLSEEGVEVIDLIDFCRCDKIIVLRISEFKNRHIYIDRIIRRCEQFVGMTENYECNFEGINHRLYSLDLVEMCYKEFGFLRINNKVTSHDIIDHPGLEIIYGNEVLPI